MILDASALLAILLGEPEADEMAGAIATADIIRLSAATCLETAIIVDSSRTPTLTDEFDSVLSDEGIQIEAVSVEQALIARSAYRRFGKGSGHPARLNFGECFAYALAKARHEPLLFKGNDFAQTDIEPALKPEQPPASRV